MSPEEGFLNTIALGIYVVGAAVANMVIWGPNWNFLSRYRRLTRSQRTTRHLMSFFWPIGLPLWLILGSKRK